MSRPQPALSATAIIEHTRKWVEQFIVGHTICPFARRELERGSIAYDVGYFDSDDEFYTQFSEQLEKLNAQPECETILWLLPQLDSDFDSFLNHAGFAQQIIALAGYSGRYQIANFHPYYVFTGSDVDDPANYTNRSPHACLHLLREESMAQVIRAHKHADQIPQRNIDYLRQMPEKTLQQIAEAIVRKR